MADLYSDIHGCIVVVLALLAILQLFFGQHDAKISNHIGMFALLLLAVSLREALQYGYLRVVLVIESLLLAAIGVAGSSWLGDSKLGSFAPFMGGVGFTMLSSWVAFRFSYFVKSKELMVVNANLEQTVALRTAQLNASIDELKLTREAMIRSETLAGLGGLVAGVSHEMSTPVANALVSATLLQEKVEALKDVAPEQKTEQMTKLVALAGFSADIIVRNVARLEQLIQSFRSVSVDQASMRKREFDLTEVVEHVSNTLSPSLQNGQVILSHDIEPGIMLNSYPGALEHVIINLVTNSIQHAFDPPHLGVSRIELHAAHVGQSVELTIADNGVGMDALVSKHAFDLFFTTKMGNGGTGIGMSIVHRMVTDVLSGRVDLETAPGKGLKVKIVLPLLAPDTADVSLSVGTV